MARWSKRKILDWIETQLNLPLVYLDFALRWLTQGKIGDLYDNLYILWMTISTYAVRQTEEGTDKICIDEDGLHFKGEEWQNTGDCNHRVCVTHDTVKEMRCPVMPKVIPEGCQIIKGCSMKFPKCCDQIKCRPNVVTPYIQRPEPIYLREQSYKHI